MCRKPRQNSLLTVFCCSLYLALRVHKTWQNAKGDYVCLCPYVTEPIGALQLRHLCIVYE